MLRKILSLIISAMMIFSLLSVGVSAEENTSSSSAPSAPTGKFTVGVDTVNANAGDSVIVKLRIKNNPGVMAMTISITYDSSALIFEKYYYGLVFEDYTLKEHPSRNIIRLVISEKQDVYGDGAIIGIKFKIADNAEAKLHEMTVKYSSGDFCNNNLERLMPVIEPGGVNVAYNGSNCAHREYGEWSESMPPTCTEEGAQQRECTLCGHIEFRSTEPVGHNFSDKFTVDIPATKDRPGTMSRHCLNCSFSTDETNFTLAQSEEGNIDNTPNSTVTENDIVKDIIEKQHPDLKEENQSTNSSSDSAVTEDNSSAAQTDSENNDTSNENDKTKEQIKDIIEIISPDKSEDEIDISAVSIMQKLREVFPQIDKLIEVIKISVITLFLIIIL